MYRFSKRNTATALGAITCRKNRHIHPAAGSRPADAHGILHTMRATVDLPLFLPLLESGACIVTPGKRLAREITELGQAL